jgi:hypothetical protein
LVVEVLSELPILQGIEDLLQDVYTFFCKSPKKHLEFIKLAEFFESKGNKILRNIKTRWLSVLAPTVRVMTEFKPLLVKIHQDATTKKPKKISTTCDSHLTDFKIIVGLTCLLPMLCVTNKVMKFAQATDVYVCDFLVAIKSYNLTSPGCILKKLQSSSLKPFGTLML